MSKFKRFALSATVAISLTALACALYLPYLGNQPVFDDHNFFTNLGVYDSAQNMFDLLPRTFPNFTLGVVHVLTGSIAANRVVSLILHALSALMLYALLASLLRKTAPSSQPPAESSTNAWLQAGVPAAAVATWFLIHPVAVYGAGYLAQRTILLATLFSLLSAWFYRRSFAENRWADIVTAALFSSLAVMSKEHAIMVSMALAPIGLLYERDWRKFAKRAALFVALSAPAALLVMFGKRFLALASYEPYINVVLSQIEGIPLLKKEGGPWLVSVILQAGEFFDYWYYWLFPDVRHLSADMRVDFVSVWNHWTLVPKALLFLAIPLLALAALRRGGRAALAGCGLLYFWLLFMTESISVRLQEPFVLYRSYIWAPGIAMLLAAALGSLRWQRNAVILAFAIPVLFLLAQTRLDSMATEFALWQDAASKLPRVDAPGADRIYYNRGGEYFKQKNFEAALQDMNQVIALSPTSFHGFLGRAKIHLAQNSPVEALRDLDHALALKPPKKGFYGMVQFDRGVSLMRLKRQDEAMAAFMISADDGFYGAKMLLRGSDGPRKDQ